MSNKRIDTRKLRQALGMSLNRFSRALGVGRRTTMRWENDDVAPSPLARQQLQRFQSQVSEAGEGTAPPQAARAPRRNHYEAVLPASQNSQDRPQRVGVVPSGGHRNRS